MCARRACYARNKPLRPRPADNSGTWRTNLTALEVYDPATNVWTNLAPMSVPPNHTAGAFINGIFYVVGGRGGAGAPTALEGYNPETNSWSTRAPMPTGRSGVAAAAVGGELIVFGGEIPDLHGEVEAYNPVTNTWRSLPPMPTPRHGIWSAVIGDRVFLSGGSSAQNFAATNTNEVFTLDRKATFANISTRRRVGTDQNVLIGRFIVTAATAQNASCSVRLDRPSRCRGH